MTFFEERGFEVAFSGVKNLSPVSFKYPSLEVSHLPIYRKKYYWTILAEEKNEGERLYVDDGRYVVLTQHYAIHKRAFKIWRHYKDKEGAQKTVESYFSMN